MRQIWAICFFEIRRVFKQRKSWIMMFVMPLVFAFVFGNLTGSSGPSRIHLAIVDEDHSSASQDLVKKLNQDSRLKINEPTRAEALVQMHDKDISGLITIPAGYEAALESGKKAEATFQHGPDLTTAPTIRQTIENAMAQASIQVRAAQTWSHYSGNSNWQSEYDKLQSLNEKPLVAVDATMIAENNMPQNMTNSTERAVGFSIMFVMMSLMSVTGTILDARKNGVWYRILSSPIARLQILTGYMLSFFLTGWIQFGILMAATSFLFNIQWGDWLGQFVLVSALLLCIVGLGLFLAGIVKTTEQQSALGSLIIISTCMLGGVYWPLDIVSDTMRKIADFVPQTWAMQGFTELVARGGTVADILGPVAVLLGFAVVFLVAGISRVRYE